MLLALIMQKLIGSCLTRRYLNLAEFCEVSLAFVPVQYPSIQLDQLNKEKVVEYNSTHRSINTIKQSECDPNCPSRANSLLLTDLALILILLLVLMVLVGRTTDPQTNPTRLPMLGLIILFLQRRLQFGR